MNGMEIQTCNRDHQVRSVDLSGAVGTANNDDTGWIDSTGFGKTKGPCFEMSSK